MTVLAQDAAIGDNQLLIDSAFPDGSFPAYVKIDDEILTVGGQDNLSGKTLILSVPVAATHTAGDTVIFAGRPWDSDFLSATGGGGGGGAEQTVRLLGPFHVDYQDPGLVNPFNAGIAAGFLIPAGATILALWMTQTGSGWTADPAHWLQLAFGSAANATQVVTLDGDAGPGTGPRGNGPFPLSTDVSANLIPFVTTVSGDIVVSWNDVNGEVSGEGDVYALIAEPA